MPCSIFISQVRNDRLSLPFLPGGTKPKMQKLHLVMGGRVSNPQSLEFSDLKALDIVGVFPDYGQAEEAWRANAQRTVDDAEMRYVIVHLHRLLDPSHPGE